MSVAHCCYHVSFMTRDKYSLLAVEDKVKDQLEAAHPEPIIEEVVSTPFYINGIFSVEKA